MVTSTLTLWLVISWVRLRRTVLRRSTANITTMAVGRLKTVSLRLFDFLEPTDVKQLFQSIVPNFPRVDLHPSPQLREICHAVH